MSDKEKDGLDVIHCPECDSKRVKVRCIKHDESGLVPSLAFVCRDCLHEFEVRIS